MIENNLKGHINEIYEKLNQIKYSDLPELPPHLKEIKDPALEAIIIAMDKGFNNLHSRIQKLELVLELQIDLENLRSCSSILLSQMEMLKQIPHISKLPLTHDNNSDTIKSNGKELQ